MARKIRDEERGGKAKIVVIGKFATIYLGSKINKSSDGLGHWLASMIC